MELQNPVSPFSRFTPQRRAQHRQFSNMLQRAASTFFILPADSAATYAGTNTFRGSIPAAEGACLLQAPVQTAQAAVRERSRKLRLEVRSWELSVPECGLASIFFVILYQPARMSKPAGDLQYGPG